MGRLRTDTFPAEYSLPLESAVEDCRVDEYIVGAHYDGARSIYVAAVSPL